MAHVPTWRGPPHHHKRVNLSTRGWTRACLHVLKRRLRAEAESAAGSSSVFLPRITAGTAASLGHPAHLSQPRGSVQTPRHTRSRRQGPDQSQRLGAFPGRSRRTTHSYRWILLRSTPCPAWTNLRELRVCFLRLSPRVLPPGRNFLKGKAPVQSGKETKSESLMRRCLLNGRQMAPE